MKKRPNPFNLSISFVRPFIPIFALGISILSLSRSCQANKISKESLGYSIESKRARFEIPLGTPKIKITRTDNGFEVTFYVPIKNVGQSPANIISYEISGKFEITDSPVKFKDKLPIPFPFNIKPGDEFYLSQTCAAVISNLSEREDLIKKIEDGKTNISVDISVTYADLFTSKVYYLSVTGFNFNNKSFSISNILDLKQ